VFFYWYTAFGPNQGCLVLIAIAESGKGGTSEPEGDEDSGGLAPFLSEDEDSEQDSLSGIKKTNSRFFEHMSNIKTIVGQLGRIGTAIRRSGAKYRYRKADESLDEEKFGDFRQYLTVIILSGSISLNRELPVNAAVFQSKIFDPARLTTVQKRLIQANIIRRNRIEYATRHMKPVSLPMNEQPTENPSLIREIVAPMMGSVAGQSSLVRKQTSAMAKTVKPKAASTTAPSLSKTATEIGSQFNFSMEMSKKSTPSTITRVTQTGNVLDYPKCPKQKSDKNPFIECPYCANWLPDDYSKLHSRWRYEICLTLQLNSNPDKYRLVDMSLRMFFLIHASTSTAVSLMQCTRIILSSSSTYRMSIAWPGGCAITVRLGQGKSLLSSKRRRTGRPI
jgi:hypothetical protein